MQGIKKAVLLLALSQLCACAVMSKKECLDANWLKVGYGVGAEGDIKIGEAFNVREHTCAKHGVVANWQQFKQGHGDGIVQFCQLSNALELGAKGITRAIDDQICAEHDYPGFSNAFGVGYKLHELRSRVYSSRSIISDLNSRIYRYEKDIRRINHKLDSDEVDKEQRKYLRRERRQIRSHIYELDHEIAQCERRLYQDQAAANNYHNSIYQDYLLNLSNELVDPRNRKRSTSSYESINKSKPGEFNGRIDDAILQ